MGLKGIVIAGLLAAIMSSLAGSFNSISVLFTNDYYKIRYPEASERKLVLVGRLATTAAVVGAILIVPLVKVISSQIYLFLQSVQSFVSPPITAVFLFGLFSKRLTAKTAFTTLIFGEIIGIGRLVLQILKNNSVELHPFFIWILNINFLHFSIFLFVLSIILILVMSFLKQPEKISFRINLSNMVAENVTEFASGIIAVKQNKKMNSSLVMSVVILVIIIGLWSLWN